VRAAQQVVPGHGRVVQVSEHIGGGGDAESADVDQCPDQAQPPGVLLAVVGLVGGGGGTPGEQAFAQVVLDGGDGYAGVPAQLADSHR
jgi:hypothetical protein